MNQVKSAHHAIEHFGSVKYAELVDRLEENVPIAAVLYEKFIFLTMKKNLQKLFQ